MEQIIRWLPMAGTIIFGAFSIAVGSGYLSRSSDLSEYKTSVSQTYAQSSDVSALESRIEKKLDSMDKRFDRLEDLVLDTRKQK